MTGELKIAFPVDLQSKLPPENMEMVMDNLDFPIGEVEAKGIRKELMAERRVNWTGWHGITVSIKAC